MVGRGSACVEDQPLATFVALTKTRLEKIPASIYHSIFLLKKKPLKSGFKPGSNPSWNNPTTQQTSISQTLSPKFAAFACGE